MARKSQEQLDADLVRLGQSIGHPVRVRILRAVAQADRPISPNALSKALEVALGNVAYHVRRFERLGVVELRSETPRRRGAGRWSTTTR